MFYAGTLLYPCYLAQSINKYEMILKKAGKDAHVALALHWSKIFNLFSDWSKHMTRVS